MAEVRLVVDLAHPAERVWPALTVARLLGVWFMPTDLEPREGGRFTLHPGTLPGFFGLVSGELTELAAPHRMVMLWRGEKLHTRVSWQVVGATGGCRLQVWQTGFIGAPAAPRRQALGDTYARLFAGRLPALLDRLAGGAFRAGGNVAVSAWSAGRTLGPAVGAACPPRPGSRDDEDRPGALSWMGAAGGRRDEGVNGFDFVRCGRGSEPRKPTSSR